MIIVLIAGLLNLLFVSSIFAGNSEEKKAALAEKVKAGIAKLGTGPDSKVEIKLYDKTKIKGYVKEAAPDNFVVVDAKTGAEKVVSYSSVKQVQGSSLSKGTRIAIFVGIGIGLAVLLAILIGRDG